MDVRVYIQGRPLPGKMNRPFYEFQLDHLRGWSSRASIKPYFRLAETLIAVRLQRQPLLTGIAINLGQ